MIRGSQSRLARLIEDEVVEIRTELARGVSQADLCRRFRIKAPAISAIANGQH